MPFMSPLLQKLGQFKSILSIQEEKQTRSLKHCTLCQQICCFCSTDAQQLTIQYKQIPGCCSVWQPSDHLSHRQSVMPVRWWVAKTVDGCHRYCSDGPRVAICIFFHCMSSVKSMWSFLSHTLSSLTLSRRFILSWSVVLTHLNLPTVVWES